MCYLYDLMSFRTFSIAHFYFGSSFVTMQELVKNTVVAIFIDAILLIK
ncbi:hypothetical protein D351_00532 [Enterococcus faecalis WKS-26-18-2]|nr:hypothetical protein D351_00532 [Enterococcus faecalis WKS-26-18-2]